MKNAAKELLKEDKNPITYRKSLRKITGSVTATILLQQMIFRGDEKGKFYKFKSAPSNGHKLYRKGDSWTEELGFSIKEFDNALKRIGTKITKGIKRSDILTKDDATGIIIYWTDRDRVTWYEINEPLLDRFLGFIYVNDQWAFTRKTTNGHLHVKDTKGHLHSLTENTTENTTETLAPAAKAEQNGGLCQAKTFEREGKELFISQADTFSDTFGPNPRQAEIDNHKNKPRLTKDELLLASLAPDISPTVKHNLDRIDQAGWNIKNAEERKAIAEFLAVTAWPIPGTKLKRNKWLTGVREHIAEELFRDRLPILYSKVWQEIKPAINSGELTITHPKAFTTWMDSLVQKDNKPKEIPDKNILLDRMTKAGEIELKNNGSGLKYYWTTNNQLVTKIPKEVSEKYAI